MLIYYITDRTQFAGSEAERRAQLLQTLRRASAAGVDYIQLRETDLCIRELEALAHEALTAIRAEGASRLLIHHRTDVALAVGADGVHLTDSDIAASDALALAAGVPRTGALLVAVSCHSAQQVRLAEAHGADFAVLSPIFEKAGARHEIGLEELRLAAQKDRRPDLRVEAGDTRRSFPVFAMGGIAPARAPQCTAAGAAGIAGTRFIQQCQGLPALVRSLRSTGA